MTSSLIKKIDSFLSREDNIVFRATPADNDEILMAEKQLSLKFNADYKEFILRYGGAYVGIAIYAFKNSQMLENSSVVDLTLKFREELKNIIDGYYVISFDGSGNPILMNKKGEIKIYDHDIGKTSVLAKSLEELINSSLY